MATYEESGVNIDLGDECSRIAYSAAKETFVGRKGMIGEPIIDDGGFTGALDMGDFYLIQNDDGVGTKIIVAEKTGKYDTLGYDLLCMVVDDAVCVGAEPISVTNTLDVNKLDKDKVTALMSGLKKAALEHKVVIPGGEIAELGSSQTGYIWNATCVGIVEKSKLITGEKIVAGDKMLGLYSPGFRSNGFSLVRYILEQNFGENWANEKYDDSTTWGERVLVPSKIFCSAILEMHGRYKQPSQVEIKGIAHITGGGIPGNLPRILKKTGLNYKLTNLLEPDEVVKKLIELGKVSEEEAYKTWNMGVGMVIVASESQIPKMQEICERHGIKSQVIGEII